MSFYELLQKNKQKDANNPYGMDMSAYGVNPTQSAVTTAVKTPYTNEYFNPTSTDISINDGEGFFDSLTGKDYLQGGMGALQTGMGLYNAYNNAQLNNAKIDGLNQQIASSKYAISAHKDFTSGTKKAFS